MKLRLTAILPLFLICFLFSCSKDDAGTGGGGTPSVAAKTMLNESYGTDPLQKMDIYLPANRSVTATKVIIMIHGGGWTGGDKSDFINMIDS